MLVPVSLKTPAPSLYGVAMLLHFDVFRLVPVFEFIFGDFQIPAHTKASADFSRMRRKSAWPAFPPNNLSISSIGTPMIET